MSWYTPSHRDSQAIVRQDPPESFFMLLHPAHLLCVSRQLAIPSIFRYFSALILGYISYPEAIIGMLSDYCKIYFQLHTVSLTS